jgi:signal transduction histidine kinase
MNLLRSPGQPVPDDPASREAPASGSAFAPLEAVLDAIPLPAVVLDRDAAVRHANEAVATMLGVARQELIGLSYRRWRALVAAFFTVEEVGGGTAVLSDLEWTERFQTPGPSPHTYRLESRPVRAEGRVVARVEVLRDTTSQERAEGRSLRELQQSREMAGLLSRLEQAEKFKMELTANVSHDLRTPLASIKASVSGLLAGDVAYDPDVLRETLTVIEEETDRLQRRVQNLLSMSRMEAGDAIQHRDWLDVADVVASALEALRSLRGVRPIQLSFADDLPLVFADYDSLQIGVRNLIENAFLYSPPVTPVEVSVHVSLGQVRIRVRDHGPGLMPDETERVFEKFYRGRSARRTPGTGLGLPICRGIAEAHGGRLWAEHEAGGGVAFVLSLPVDQDAGLEASIEP